MKDDVPAGLQTTKHKYGTHKCVQANIDIRKSEKHIYAQHKYQKYINYIFVAFVLFYR